MTGSIQQGGTYLDNLDVTLSIDADRAWNIRGGRFFAYLVYNNSNLFSERFVGDTQGINNIEAPAKMSIEELWWEQRFGSHSLKVGFYDFNSEFDAIASTALFINSSHGIGPDISQSGENGPSIFPITSLAVRYMITIRDHLSVQAVVLDAVPGDPDDVDRNTIHLSGDEGALLAAEINYRSEINRIGFGVWHYTADTESLDGAHRQNNQGIYAIGEHWFEQTKKNHPENLSIWLRVGTAREGVNQFQYYAGTGLGFMLIRILLLQHRSRNINNQNLLSHLLSSLENCYISIFSHTVFTDMLVPG